jgi:hypothetical protein
MTSLTVGGAGSGAGRVLLKGAAKGLRLEGLEVASIEFELRRDEVRSLLTVTSSAVRPKVGLCRRGL